MSKPTASGGFGAKLAAALRYAFLTGYLLAVVFPMLWVFYTSAKSTRDVFA